MRFTITIEGEVAPTYEDENGRNIVLSDFTDAVEKMAGLVFENAVVSSTYGEPSDEQLVAQWEQIGDVQTDNEGQYLIYTGVYQI